MKTLLLMRHAKSSWDQPGQSDHERPLNARGVRTAPIMAQHLESLGLFPDLIISSTANRALSTAKLLLENSSKKSKIVEDDSLYLAEPRAYFDAVALYGSEEKIIMAIGHNPGLEEAVSTISKVDQHFPTAAIAQLEVNIEHWGEISENSEFDFQEVWRPKEL